MLQHNKADTVLSCFLNAVSSYGLPTRVRADRGEENVLVADYMLSHPARGTGQGSLLLVKACIIQELKGYGKIFFGVSLL